MRFPSNVSVFLACGVICFGAVTANAQAENANEAAYHILLQQVADQKISLAQQQVFLAGQELRIAALTAQLDGLDDTKASIGPMIEKMTAAIEIQIKADYPFKMDTRLARLQSLRELVEDENATVGAKYRKALDVYKIEVNYGQGLEGYSGNHPTAPTLREGDDRFEQDEDGVVIVNENTGIPVEIFDGDYLRYGRTALVYINTDGSGALRYDLGQGEWVDDLPGGKIVEIRRAIRVSRGEVAPGVVIAPVQSMP